jgi:hypothetical protein
MESMFFLAGQWMNIIFLMNVLKILVTILSQINPVKGTKRELKLRSERVVKGDTKQFIIIPSDYILKSCCRKIN